MWWASAALQGSFGDKERRLSMTRLSAYLLRALDASPKV
jgi:hypothetical protein